MAAAMVCVETSSTEHAGVIGQLYVECFPKSVSFFFPHAAIARVHSLASLGFEFLLLMGCRAFIALNHDDKPLGYCVVSKRGGGFLHRILRAQIILGLVSITIRAVRLLHPGELVRLTHNWLLFTKGAVGDMGPSAATKGRIVSIAVHPSARGRGVGQFLLQRALEFLDREQVQATYLEVRPDNLPARNLYEKSGFIVYGQNQDLLGQWLKMVRLRND